MNEKTFPAKFTKAEMNVIWDACTLFEGTEDSDIKEDLAEIKVAMEAGQESDDGLVLLDGNLLATVTALLSILVDRGSFGVPVERAYQAVVQQASDFLFQLATADVDADIQERIQSGE